MIMKCCVCSRVKIDGKWRRNISPAGEQISHAYCPTCFSRAMARIDRLVREKALKSSRTGLAAIV